MIDINEYRDPIYDVEPNQIRYITPIEEMSGGGIENNVITEIFKTYEINRLAHLRHTGLLFLTYPASTQNRLSHVLGTSILAGYINQRIKLYSDKSIFIHESLETMLKTENLFNEFNLSIFIHDIGHIPYSYYLEDIPIIRDNLKGHREIACSLLVSENALYKKLKQSDVSKGLPTILETIMSEYNIDSIRNLVCGSSEGNKNHIEEIAQDILWSPIGINEFDNFLRTSFFTGVKRGTINVKNYLDSILIVNNSIGIDANSVDHILFYLWNKDILEQRIFNQEELSAYQAMLQYVTEYWLNQGDNVYSKILDLVFFTESEFIYKLKQSLPEKQNRIIDSIFSWNPYKCIFKKMIKDNKIKSRDVREEFFLWKDELGLPEGDFLIYIPKGFDKSNFYHYKNTIVFDPTSRRIIGTLDKIASNLLNYLENRYEIRRRTIKIFADPESINGREEEFKKSLEQNFRI